MYKYKSLRNTLEGHFHLKIKGFLLISIATLFWWELIGVKKTSFKLNNFK